jgi:hypothetical protein
LPGTALARRDVANDRQQSPDRLRLNVAARVLQRGQEQIQGVLFGPQVERLFDLSDELGAPPHVGDRCPFRGQPRHSAAEHHARETVLDAALFVRRPETRDGLNQRRVSSRSQFRNCPHRSPEARAAQSL